MARFYDRLVDDRLVNGDPWDLGVPDHDEDVQTVVVLPKEVARHLRTYLTMWRLYGDTCGADHFTREEVEAMSELFDATDDDRALLEWLAAP